MPRNAPDRILQVPSVTPSLRMVSYNVRYFGHATRGLASTHGALTRIAHTVAHLDPLPDIICLQEVETVSLRSTIAAPWPASKTQTPSQLSRFVHALQQGLQLRGLDEVYDSAYFRAHDYRVTSRTSVYTTGLAMLVRRPLRFAQHNAQKPADITHRPPRLMGAQATAGQWLKQTRICAHAVIEHPSGASFDVFTTHLSLPAFYRREFWTQPERMGWGHNQLEEVRTLAGFVEQERSSDRFLVAGDFNALPGSPVYDHLTTQLGWQDALTVALGSDLDRLRKFPTAGFMHLRMHLDHVLSGPGLHWSDVHGTFPFGDAQNPFHGLSDHVPIVGRFTWPNNGAIDERIQ